MGKTPRPLKILCVGIWGEEFVTLQNQGHTVHTSLDVLADDMATYDLIAGPKCWRLLPHLLKYLPLAVKEARAAMPKKVTRG